MRFVKTILLWVMLSFGVLAVATAQPCPVTTPQITCAFVAVDVQTNQVVDKLCVGRTVRFDRCAGRDPALVIYYQVRQGAGVLPNPCAFPSVPPTFTPTQAGPITVTENANTGIPGSTSTIYFKVFEVYGNPKPAFTALPCSPGFVQVTVTDATYPQYFVRIGNGPSQPAIRNQAVTYVVPPGADSIRVTGAYTDNSLCGNTSSQRVPQLAAPGPLSIQRLTLQGTTAQLDVEPLVAGYRYSVERADASGPGGYQTVPGAVQNSPTSFSIPNAQPGCYRLRRADDCGRDLAFSGLVCTVSLTATAAERRNELTWQLDASPVSYELTRNNAPLPLSAPLAPGARAYTDTTGACGVQYTYRLTARYAGAISVSNEATVRATATQAPATPSLFATFDLRNRVVLTTSVRRFPTTGQLTYLRDNAVLTTTAARTLRDSARASFAASTVACYQVRFVDDCNNRSADSAPFCPVVLGAELVNPRAGTIRLTWSALRGAPAATPTDTVRYRLLVLAPDNSVLRTIPVSSRGSYLDLSPPTDQQTARYRIEATGAGLPAPSYSNIAGATRPIEAYIPTAFTPNGDGLNDVLEVKGRFLKTFRFVIVDRNGQQVFTSTERSQTWDGRIRNEKPVPGAYVWRLEATDDIGRSVVQHGTVTILK